jgi:hypothetical protein
MTIKADVIRRQATFGTADGVSIAPGLIVLLSGDPHAVVKAARGAGLAEFPGVAAGQYLSDKDAGVPAALANGLAAIAGCILPVVPTCSPRAHLPHLVTACCSSSPSGPSSRGSRPSAAPQR